MADLKQIDDSLDATLRNSDLSDLSVNLIEVGIDSVIKEGTLRDIPILSSVIGVGKLALSVKDHLFLKKLIHFLSALNEVSPEERNKMIDGVDQNKRYRIKVGEQLMYLLDKCDDHIDATYIAQLFCSFIKGKISYDDFLKGSRIIQSIHTADLEYFLITDLSEFEKTTPTEEMPNDTIYPLINAGICGISYEPIAIEDQYDRKSNEKYIVRGGDAVVWVTSIGHLLKDNLKSQPYS